MLHQIKNDFSNVTAKGISKKEDENHTKVLTTCCLIKTVFSPMRKYCFLKQKNREESKKKKNFLLLTSFYICFFFMLK